MTFVPNVGVSVTVVSLAASIVPVTTMTPVAAPTEMLLAYFVAAKPDAQESSEVGGFGPDCTTSVTQVRAPLAANTISDALARLV